MRPCYSDNLHINVDYFPSRVSLSPLLFLDLVHSYIGIGFYNTSLSSTFIFYTLFLYIYHVSQLNVKNIIGVSRTLALSHCNTNKRFHNLKNNKMTYKLEGSKERVF